MRPAKNHTEGVNHCDLLKMGKDCQPLRINETVVFRHFLACHGKNDFDLCIFFLMRYEQNGNVQKH